MERFWAKVDKRGADECWQWLATRSGGYGRFVLNGEVVGAHRAAWELQNGAVPPGMFVCHRCDNRRCVNAAHLFLGTPADNVRDMWEKGRARPRKRKIDVAAAVAMRSAGLSQREIARRFGATQPSVWAALRRSA